MSDTEATNSYSSLGAIKATQDLKVAPEKKVRQLDLAEVSKVDTPSPKETVSESSVRLAKAVDATAETISPERMGD